MPGAVDIAIYRNRDDLLVEITGRLAGYAGDYDVEAIADALLDDEVPPPLVQARLLSHRSFMELASQYARDAVPGCRP